MYSALMIDLKNSRAYSLEKREAIQRYIAKIYLTLNEIISGVKLVKFSAGDELQGLFYSPMEAYLYYRLFSMLIYPVKIRAGIGVGSWDIKIDNEETTAQDGQVYYRARKAISEADELNGYPILYYSGNKADTVVNSLIGGAAGINERMNTYQNEMMLLAELLSPLDMYGKLDKDALLKIGELIAYKREFDFYKDELKPDKKYPFDRFNMVHNKEIQPVDVAEIKDWFYIASGKPRGLPSKLSIIMGISRQSVEKTLKTANIFVARNMSISALKVMVDTN